MDFVVLTRMGVGDCDVAEADGVSAAFVGS